MSLLMNAPDKAQAPSDRSRIRRASIRAEYSQAATNAILDAGMMGHLGFVLDGAPFVIPMLYWRHEDRLYWHASSVGRLAKQLAGQEVCFSVAHLDGVVLARSAFHHSANYRSVVLFGRAEEIVDRDAKLRALEDFMEGLFPGRWDTLRPVSAKELNATAMFSMTIDDAAAKVRTGPPLEEARDVEWPVWAGVLPIRTVVGAAVPAPNLRFDSSPPELASLPTLTRALLDG